MLLPLQVLDGFKHLVQSLFKHLLLGLDLGLFLLDLDLPLEQLLLLELELLLVQLVLLLQLLLLHHQLVLLLKVVIVILLLRFNDLGHQLILILNLLLNLHTQYIQLIHLLLIPDTLIIDQILQMDDLVTNPVLLVRVLLDLLPCVSLDLAVLLMGAVDEVLIDGGLGHLVVRVVAREVVIDGVQVGRVAVLVGLVVDHLDGGINRLR